MARIIIMNTKELVEQLVEHSFDADPNVQYHDVKVVKSGTREELGIVSMVYLTTRQIDGDIVLIVK